ncbi:DNA-binding protein RFX6-like [Mya arenaria]|uniref:DNA-binding protein RFX6-like n=1 Tax=Mya arenaria TaxID=6604 RepID=UPI0022E565CC|nr:DNA-binding protein RFX6-like [Mya arenaria]
MDTLSLHLPPVIPDSYYDIPGTGAGYQAGYETPVWTTRDEGSRGCPPAPRERVGDGAFTTNALDTADHQPPNQQTDIDETDWPEDGEGRAGGGRSADKASPRQSQVALTLHWLSDNYERAEGVCLPRCVLYQHYQDFCKKMKFTPAGAATFGKIIRQRFPKLTTRRLGTRGQSKYHYYGIGIKESSIYYHSVYSGKGLTRFSGIKLKTEGSSRKYSLNSKTGTLLPEFPKAENLILPPGTELEKMRTFIIMYRTHCQRILDTVISANFEEVQNFLVHFWQGMPEHLLDLLSCSLLPDIVGLCDSILYKVLLDVLIPSSIQDLPNTLLAEMRLFAKHLPFWIESSMETVSKNILDKKLEVAKTFILSLRRQSSFVHLAQTSRAVIANQELIGQIVKDISAVDFEDICNQSEFLQTADNPKFSVKMQEFYEEFKELLSKQSSIEGYTEWIDNVVEKNVLLPSGENADVFKEKAAEFILQWGAFSGLLMRELTLLNSTSFASIHIVHLMLDEYTFLVIETQQDTESEAKLQKELQKHMKNAEVIQTKSVVRNNSSKTINSPKTKKKRHAEEYDGLYFLIQDTTRTQESNFNSTPTDSLSTSTAFSRPVHTSHKDMLQSGTCQVGNYSQNIRPQNGAISVPPLKPYQPYNNTFERPTYLPQFGIGSYPDYIGHGAAFGSGRIPNYTDSYTQPFSTTPFPSNLSSNLSSVSGSYWTDGRPTHSFNDPYQHYNKLNPTYDTFNKTSLLRNNAYQDTIARSTFEPPRPYYRSPHDNFQVGPSLQMSSYGANFMDIAPSGGQYCYQEDLFTGSVASFAKPFLSGPFR